ncbi:MOSC domain-containing protein [Paludibacterium sp.]|uniref:MOSC domain-containing protein n=1 Tax=Paludibacterium sp. TaxID=1917523 RepID=UPI0025F42390|nr:MOSC domain-containing protein [Paludibacterium sp.]MBV8647437.1 MOSC domain-containing protein [Paludibacterium sp.]
MQLNGIFVHPLKSGRGIAYSQAYASTQGFLHDREWLVVNAQGQFLTARTHPQLVRVEIELMPGAALFKAPGMAPIAALTTQFNQPVDCQVWDDYFVAQQGDPRLDAWFSQVAGQPCRLLWLGQTSNRKQKGDVDETLSFADGYPYLLVNQASLDALNHDLQAPVTTRHFRPNLIVGGMAAYEEDDWRRIRIGTVDFEVTKPCSRCVLTTVDPETGEKDPRTEPLKTLIRTRQFPEGICFGVNLRALNEGVVHVGDALEILESRYAF